MGDQARRSSGKLEDGLDKSPGFHSSSQGPRKTLSMLPGFAQNPFSFWGKFRHAAIEFLAQSLMSLGPLFLGLLSPPGPLGSEK